MGRMPPLSETWARRLARAAARDVDPNALTWASLAAALLAAAAFHAGLPVHAAPLVALSGFLDLVDGEVARSHGRSTRLGDFLDHTLDRVGDSAVFVGLGLGPMVPLEVGLGAALSTVLVAYLGTQAEAVGLERVYGGLARRSNVMALVFVASLAEAVYAGALVYAAWLVVALSAATFLQRFLKVYRSLA
ncbi:MAG: Archaetidylinositol phosphate synthase [Methanonatronarchaeales archaeon]|nr:Archaetidylinositol phosphate synthase [Methanonatronarchaeales archaeon]